MTIEQPDWEEFVNASAKALGLTLEPSWREIACANLQTIFKMAALVEEFQLPNDIEPAPVFEA
jgi:hypothetical protein